MQTPLISAKLFFIFFISLSYSINLSAQGVQGSITGTIRNANGEVVSHSTILLRNESTGFTTSSRTGEHGTFDIKQLPLGGPYTLNAKHIEYGNGTVSGIQINQGDVIQLNINLVASSTELEAVEVRASQIQNSKDYIGAATAFSSKDLRSLPVNGRNFTTLTDLSPIAKGGNISGQLGSSNSFTIDGMQAKNETSEGSTSVRAGAPYSISMEAIREFKVVTNQYDVTFGRSGGGTIAAATKAGTNTLTGSVFGYGRADWLTSKYNIRGEKRMGSYATYQYGFSLGGPIIKDKLHYFVVWDRQKDNRSLQIADIQSAADETFYKINQSTLDQYLAIARNKYGVSDQQQYGSIPKNRNSDAVFVRLDYQINEKNLLTLRNNYTADKHPLALHDNTAINLLESYGNETNRDNSLLATLRTAFSPRVTNELKVQHLYIYQDYAQGDQINKPYIPRAVVEKINTNINGQDLSTDIQLGGQRYAQESAKNHVFQLTNNLFYDTDFGNYTFGIDLLATRSKSNFGSEVNGRFFFNKTDDNISSLDNFNNLKPYRYYREVPLKDDISVKGTLMNMGLYGQLKKDIAPGLEMTAGLRLDVASYPTAVYNELVYTELGLRTDNKLKSFILQPRVQFSWDINNNQTDYLRFGAGIFAATINNYMMTNNLTFDGTNLGTIDVRGDAVPTPDFNAYRQDFNSIPSMPSQQLPTINFTGENAKVPTIYKANIAYAKMINERLKVGVTGYMTLARHNYTYIDRNMVDQPYFRLANEANRGVFVPAEKIPANNGEPDWKDGRISNKLGRVLELTSLGKINQFALVLDGTYRYFKDGSLTASYTWNDTQDNTSFNGSVANSATLAQPVVDDPRNLNSITYSDNQFRHKVVLYGNTPSFWGINLGFRYTGLGGTRYSLRSGGNTNGDFVTSDNDLAYIFDPNSPQTPQHIRDGIQGILNNPEASQSLKDLINNYAGQIATRNAGINRFFGTVDLRLSKNFKFAKNQGIEVSAELFNFGNLLNKEWGVNKSLSNQALYKVQGFDQENKAFQYAINSVGATGFSGNPYQVQLGLRYAF